MKSLTLHEISQCLIIFITTYSKTPCVFTTYDIAPTVFHLLFPTYNTIRNNLFVSPKSLARIVHNRFQHVSAILMTWCAMFLSPSLTFLFPKLTNIQFLLRITAESNFRDMRIKGIITDLDCFANSLCQCYSKCIENGMENMHTDARMWRVNLKSWSVSTFFPSAT